MTSRPKKFRKLSVTYPVIPSILEALSTAQKPVVVFKSTEKPVVIALSKF